MGRVWQVNFLGGCEVRFLGVLGPGRGGTKQGVGGGPYGGGEQVDVSTSMSVGRHGVPQVVVAH